MQGEVRELCRRTFQEFIENSPEVEPDLRRFLRSHERVPLFIDNLARELSTQKFNITRDQIILATRDMTRTFVQLAKRQKQEAVMSDLAKLTLKKKSDDSVALAKAADEFESLGKQNVIQTEKGKTIVQTIDDSDRATQRKLEEILN